MARGPLCSGRARATRTLKGRRVFLRRRTGCRLSCGSTRFCTGISRRCGPFCESTSCPTASSTTTATPRSARRPTPLATRRYCARMAATDPRGSSSTATSSVRDASPHRRPQSQQSPRLRRVSRRRPRRCSLWATRSWAESSQTPTRSSPPAGCVRPAAPSVASPLCRMRLRRSSRSCGGWRPPTTSSSRRVGSGPRTTT
mmetsp:Transcript_78872/g.156799  ORF Transcript_78872/g.156799 Transcript_78872/m.156799 type:complete len:200 (+) Transcript_78872:586-1185(+)